MQAFNASEGSRHIDSEVYKAPGHAETRAKLPAYQPDSEGTAMDASTQPSMLISNTQEIPGHRIVEFYGVVSGNTVRAKHIGRDLMAGLKNIVGGELKGYTELLQDAREEATRRMIEQASSVGANAVLNVRYATSSVAQGAAELFAYGTAVKVVPAL